MDESSDDRLDSWKEIATYLRRGRTTVERWEKDEGLPVHRLVHARKGSVFAYKHELDAWRSARSQRALRLWWSPRIALIVIGVAGVLAIGGGAFLLTQSSSAALTPGGMRGSIPQPLARDSGSQAEPSLSPDGNTVVYTRYEERRRTLFIRDVETGTTRKLEIAGEGDFQETKRASWSPKGDLIAFLTTDALELSSLQIVPASGGTPRRLTSMAGIGVCWHPEGRIIGFVDRDGPATPFSVFTFSLATGERRRLTTPPATTFGDTHCAFSPDGRTIAVERHEIRSTSDLFLIDVQNPQKSPRRITRGQLGMDSIAWSPDGKQLVFGSPSGLWRVAADEETPRPELVTGSEGTVLAPSFSRPSPDGRARLAYEYLVYDVNIWRWDRDNDGAERVRRLPGSTVWDSSPSLSPDGERMAYVSNRTGSNEIWTAQADGSDARRVTSNVGTVFHPRWSPDGQRLVFASQSNGNWDVWVVRANGADLFQLTKESSQEENPTWSRDGRSVYFRSDRSGIGQIWKVAASGGAAVLMTSGPAAQAFESPDGRVLYFVRRDDLPGLWNVPIIGGPETLVSPDVSHDLWAVTNDGIGFLTRSSTGPPWIPTLRLLAFNTRTVSSLATLPAGWFLPGFSMTPNGRAVTWVRPDTRQNQLMIIPEWR